jgi:DNA-binding response OmpR family regulator
LHNLIRISKIICTKFIAAEFNQLILPRPTPMKFLTATFSILFCCIVLCQGLRAQSTAVLDTLNNRIQLMTQLSQAGNDEQAEVEAEWFRDFLKRYKIPITPRALTLISGIYKANSDDRSATRMLSEAEIDARRDPNPVTKAALLSVLVKECGRWELPELALTCQQLLGVAQDSIDVRSRRNETLGLKRSLDSLSNLRVQETAEQSRFVRLERDRAYMLGGVLFLCFLALIFANIKNTDRWRKRVAKKDVELDILRSNMRQAAIEAPMAALSESTQVETIKPPDPYALYNGEKPEQIALVIEPNRQIVLYLKSLLADRFQIETASTSTEGLQMAHNLLPDLIICDAILNNGKIGIDVARQIKLSDRTNHIPVVLLSDHHGNEGKLDALRAGADVWFTRPILDDEFDASVQRLLDGRKVKHELFARILHLYFTENRVQIDDPFLAKSVQMVEQNLSDPDYTAEDIARKLQMTKQHFFKKLKVLTGKEPVQLIREMRLEKSKVLLEKRAGTPQAIAEMVGFSNAGSFALSFKEYFGEHTLLLNLPPINRLN